MTYPIYIQSGYPSHREGSIYAESSTRVNFQAYLSGAWAHLDSMVSDNNGEVLILGDMWLPKNGYTSEDLLLLKDGGPGTWPYQLVAHDTGSGIDDRGIDAVLAELQEGTYVPSIIYVEDDTENNGSLSQVLTDEQYLILREVAERGHSALHLQVSKGFSMGTPVQTDWVSLLTDGAVELWTADQYVIAAAGGYPGGPTGYEFYEATDYAPGIEDGLYWEVFAEVNLYGWGWFVPTTVDYGAFSLADGKGGHAVLTAAQEYLDLPVLTSVAPGLQRPILSIMDWPRPVVISGRRKDVSSRFVTAW